jgi:N-acetyl-1-D-myo-inositol-2-amino-2-deoxy-alpha-D-glucopyranoside deacetylase
MGTSVTRRTGPLTGRRLLAIFAHPDDESLACGGTLAWCAAQGVHVSLLCVTRGEMGQRAPGSSDERIPLGTIRHCELHAAAERLGIDEVIVFDHPDGSLNGVDEAQFRNEMIVAIRHVRPDVVITFGPDGLYWHPDHVTVHERVTEAVAQLGATAPALFYVVFAPGMMRRVVETARANPAAPSDVSLWSLDPDAFGAYAPEPTLVIDASAFTCRKIEALRCHRTQVSAASAFSWLTAAQAPQLLGHEHFVRAATGFAGPTFLDALNPSPASLS